jgi:hypothetical protein
MVPSQSKKDMSNLLLIQPIKVEASEGDYILTFIKAKDGAI